jgi:signal transduction histidine kinase
LKGLIDLFHAGHIAPDELKLLVSKMESNITDTSMLLDNILLWSSSQTKGIRINKKNIDLCKLVDEHVRLFRLQAESKQLKIVNAIDSGSMVFADENVLRLVLRNLLSNGLKFTPEGGLIEVSKQESQNFVNLTVRDTGIGMTPDMLSSIFHDQVESHQGTANEKGNGLGLSLCRKFLTEMGSDLRVESVLDKGTSFTLLLETCRTETFTPHYA